MSTITNVDIAVYMDTTPTSSTPTFNRLGEGINTWTPSLNGQISTKHFINMKNATSDRLGTQEQWAVSGERCPGDAVNDFIISCARKLGKDAESTMLIVDMLDSTESEGVTSYSAVKYKVMIDVANNGTVAGGESVAIDATIYAKGDPVEGTVTIGEGDVATFTATA